MQLLFIYDTDLIQVRGCLGALKGQKARCLYTLPYDVSRVAYCFLNVEVRPEPVPGDPGIALSAQSGTDHPFVLMRPMLGHALWCPANWRFRGRDPWAKDFPWSSGTPSYRTPKALAALWKDKRIRISKRSGRGR